MTYPTISPSLTLDFAKSKQLDPRITFTRSSTATYLDAATELIKTVPSGVARFEKEGLLIEESRTNLVRTSTPTGSGLSNGWTQRANTTITTNAGVAPDGTTTATSVVANLNSTDRAYTQHTLSSATTADCVVSAFAKPINNFPSTIIKSGLASGVLIWNFNFQTEATTVQFETGDAAGFGSTAFMEPLANGWYRVGFTAPAGLSDLVVNAREVWSGNPSADGVSGVLWWGCQVEEGSFQTSFIPTSGSTVTRSADVATMPTAGIFGDDFTTINKDFGTVGGSDTLTVVGPNAERTVVYPEHLTQAQTNAVATGDDNDFLRMRVLGSSFALTTFRTDGSLTVDWGDGTVETLTTAEHTFTNGSGYHEIGLRLDSGTYFSPNFNGDATNAANVIAVGPCPSNMLIESRPFAKCVNMEVCDATFAHTGSSAQYLFRLNSKLKSIPFFTTSSTATNYVEAARGCELITSFPAIDLSNGTDFDRCWADCTALESFPEIDMSSATDLIDAWSDCSSLTSFPAIDFPNVTRFRKAWLNCSSLTSFPLIDTSSGTDFRNGWQGCSSLTSFPSIDMSSGTNFSSAWKNCSSLTSFPANMFDTTGTLVSTAFSLAFDGCALTAASIENILVSLDTNGAQSITLGISGGTNAGQSSWTSAATTAYNNLVTKGWTITANS